MALAVSAGVVVSAVAALVELAVLERVRPFDLRQLAAIAVSLPAIAAMALAGVAARGLGALPATLIEFAMLLPALWLALRFGLKRGDKKALGGLSRRLRLG